VPPLADAPTPRGKTTVDRVRAVQREYWTSLR
jgi:hypothetical protein